MSEINQELVARYDLLLGQIQDALNGHDRATVNTLQAWRAELRSISDQTGLKAHAGRTSRGMGGMGSLGEVVKMGGDSKELLHLEKLDAICKLIVFVTN
jgi:hypothetical protein